MIKVYYAHLAKINEDDLIKLLDPLTEKMKSRISAFKRNEDRLLKLTSLLLLKEALLNNNQFQYQLQDLKYTPAGKPYFDDAPFDFSISHSEGYAIVAFSTNCLIGIDIEKVIALDLIDFNNFFSSEIWEDINASTDVKVSFYNYWTLVESAVKADGRGLSLVSNDQIKIINRQAFIDGIRWYSDHYLIDPSYSCCLTSQKQQKVKLYEIKFVYNGSLLSCIYN